MTKKYLVCPGYVYSRTDGGRHYIGARVLMRLFKVNPEECVIYSEDVMPAPLNLIILRPRSSGNYELSSS